MKGLLASWARHEIKADSQCAPLVLEQVSHALCVIHVIARQLYARFRSKLACEADVAKVILAWHVFLALNALRLEAGQALCFVVDSAAGMAAISVNSLARIKVLDRLNNWLRRSHPPVSWIIPIL